MNILQNIWANRQPVNPEAKKMKKKQIY